MKCQCVLPSHVFLCYAASLGRMKSYWHNLGRDSKMLRKGKSDQIQALAALTPGNSLVYQMDSRFDMPQLKSHRKNQQDATL